MKKPYVPAMIKDNELAAYLNDHIQAGRTIVFISNDGTVSPIFQGETLCHLKKDSLVAVSELS